MADEATQQRWATENKAFEDVLGRFAKSQVNLEAAVTNASQEDLGKAQKKLLRHYESMVGRYAHYERVFRERNDPTSTAKADTLLTKLDSELRPRANDFKSSTEATREK